MRKGRKESSKGIVFWGLVCFGVIAFVAIFRSFHGKVNEYDQFGLDSAGRLRSVMNSQVSFMSYNKVAYHKINA